VIIKEFKPNLPLKARLMFKKIFQELKTLNSLSAITKIVLLLILAALLGATVAVNDLWETENFRTLFTQITPIRQNSKQFKYINPLFGCDSPAEAVAFSEYTPLKNKVQAIINQKNSSIQNVSFYFKDLTTGHWTGINDNLSYNPASLMKVALMIVYYHQAEENPAILQKKVTYRPYSSPEPFQAPSELKTGQDYTVEQLIEAMIIESDNGAMDTLLANVNNISFNEIFSDIGIQNPESVQRNNYIISTKTYTLFFRLLYNATYLSHDFSEKALELLSRATYKNGLVAALPQDIPVAHKFGEYVLSADGKIPTGYELHDCGIVYYPGHNYLICIMTKGRDLEDLTGIIQNISQVVYSTVQSDYKN
jgi:beta-lactamase class A